MTVHCIIKFPGQLYSWLRSLPVDNRQLQKLFFIVTEWVVPRIIHTPTKGGIEILSPPCIQKFQNALSPHAFRIPDSFTPPPLSFRIPEVFSSSSEFPIQSTTPPPRNFFFGLLKRCGVY